MDSHSRCIFSTIRSQTSQPESPSRYASDPAEEPTSPLKVESSRSFRPQQYHHHQQQPRHRHHQGHHPHQRNAVRPPQPYSHVQPSQPQRHLYQQQLPAQQLQPQSSPQEPSVQDVSLNKTFIETGDLVIEIKV